MTAKNVQSIDIAELRRRAEEHLGENNESAYHPGTVEEPLRLQHELQVQQIELEIQNAEIIRARNEAEIALERYTDLYDFAPVGYISLDRTGTILVANLTGASLLGVERSRLIGMRFAQFFAAAASYDFAVLFDKVFSNLVKHACELTLLKEGGSPLVVQIEAVAAASGQECRMALIDITKRRQAENELKAASAYNRSLIEASLDPLITIDTMGKITDVNSATEKVTGCLREELIGTDFLDYFTEPERARAGYQQVFREGTVYDYQLEIRHRDGRLTPVLYNAAVYRDERDEVAGVFAAARDITERRSLENQLCHAQKMEAIGTLAGGIAHDFNNILTAILGFGSLMEMKLAKDDPLHDNVTEILAAADRAANLTQSLLAFSRKQKLAVKPASLNEIVAGMEKMLRHLISEDIELRICLAEGMLTVLADPGQIEQVLLNLTTNARDSMQSGGAITITTEEAELDETFRRAHGYGEPGRYALITFADSGEGMEESVRQRIFEPFFTTKEMGKGTGLGLSVCYGIIKLNGGYIVCYSEPGRGTTFRIYLRLSRFSAEHEAATADVPFAGGTETILVAEDDANVRNLTSAILTEFGYTVIMAQDGVEAVAKFSEQPHDIQLCLLDVIMPKKNGRDVSEEIRKVCPDLKVLFMSGYHADITRQGELFNEGESLITKPVMPRELLQRIRELLDG